METNMAMENQPGMKMYHLMIRIFCLPAMLVSGGALGCFLLEVDQWWGSMGYFTYLFNGVYYGYNP